jgi:hypothetical protein
MWEGHRHAHLRSLSAGTNNKRGGYIQLSTYPLAGTRRVTRKLATRSAAGPDMITTGVPRRVQTRGRRQLVRLYAQPGKAGAGGSGTVAMGRPRGRRSGRLGPAAALRAVVVVSLSPARARPAGITTRFPSRVRTAKDPASACSRMPSTSVICCAVTRSWPPADHHPLADIGGVSRTTSRYRMPVHLLPGEAARAAGHRAAADAATLRYLAHGHGGVTGW